jgi:hypothetical protein
LATCFASLAGLRGETETTTGKPVNPPMAAPGPNADVAFGSKPGLPPWGPYVRFRRVQTLVRDGSPLVKLRNFCLGRRVASPVTATTDFLAPDIINRRGHAVPRPSFRSPQDPEGHHRRRVAVVGRSPPASAPCRASPALGRVCPDITSLMSRRAGCSDQQEMG